MINEGKIFGRGIAFPPYIDENGRMAWSEGAQNIRESIRIILLTDTQERLRLGEFGSGLKAFLFEPNTISNRRLIQERISIALERWEPRIRVESVTVEPDRENNQAVTATIYYKLIANQTGEKVSLSIDLTG